MKRLVALIMCAVSLAAAAQTTCVDPLACNFTEFGECEFLDDNGIPCVTEGCAIAGACNFEPEADINDGSCEFTSCLGCTDEAACNYDSEAVYLDLSCIYFVDCNGVCGGDWIEDECGNCYEPTLTEILTFTPCGNSGRYGPNQAQCDAAYGEPLFVQAENGFQRWTVPSSGLYTITAYGAQGGGNGGLGAKVSAAVELNAGSILKIGVGQQGAFSCSGGGGGSTGCSLVNGELLLIAGAGGGQGYDSSFGSPATQDAVIGVNGQDTYSTSGVIVGYGGLQGNGGSSGSNPHGDWPRAGGGAGFFSNGESGNHSSYDGGKGGSQNGEGGAASTSNCGSSPTPGHGGFGFTGGGGAEWGGGGGGGYSGGAGGASANGYIFGGGGASFCVEGALLNSTAGVHNGHGMLTIEYSIVPECLLGCVTAQACNYNSEATNDDGSCDFCFCGPGTAYDIEVGQCLVLGGGADINGDGCTNLGDLLDLLSGYGTCTN